VRDFGYCYCGLYVRRDVFEGKTQITPIPERRPAERQARAQTVSEESSAKTKATDEAPSSIKMKMWYCKQCGYVCFREDPPYICPICKANREMFAEITILTSARG
jgi:rubrerythrin